MNRVQQSTKIFAKVGGGLSWFVSFFIMFDLGFDTGAIVAYCVLSVLLMIVSAAVFGIENTLLRLVRRIQRYFLDLAGDDKADTDEVVLFSKAPGADISIVSFRSDDLHCTRTSAATDLSVENRLTS